MKLKVKRGEHLVSSFYQSKYEMDEFLINLNRKWSYIGFKQKKNQFIIETEEGNIEFVFCGEVSRLRFKYQEKEQLVFSYSSH